MGGSIRVVTIKDGVTKCTSRWTNVLPHFVKHDKFIEKDERWIKEYINQNSEYSDGSDNFSPEGYGLDVFDFDRKKIYTCQDYCGYDTIDYVAIELYVTDRVMGIDNNDTDEYYPSVAKRMWDKQMISSRIISLGTNEEDMTFIKTFDEAMKIGKQLFKDRAKIFNNTKKYLEFVINWKQFGWELKEYENWRKYFNNIRLAYNLNEEEIKGWEERISEVEDDNN